MSVYIKKERLRETKTLRELYLDNDDEFRDLMTSCFPNSTEYDLHAHAREEIAIRALTDNTVLFVRVCAKKRHDYRIVSIVDALTHQTLVNERLYNADCLTVGIPKGNYKLVLSHRKVYQLSGRALGYVTHAKSY